MGGPIDDMKKSYAPDNVSPGSIIPCVAAPKLETIKSQLNLTLGTENLSSGKVFFRYFEVVDPF
jgi:hypothetical protein